MRLREGTAEPVRIYCNQGHQFSVAEDQAIDVVLQIDVDLDGCIGVVSFVDCQDVEHQCVVSIRELERVQIV